MRGSIKAYKSASVYSQSATASQVKIVQMLYLGMLERLQQARICMEQRDMAKKGELIAKVLEIIVMLRASLDFEEGGEVARNLDGIYDYANRRIIAANVANDTEILDEVFGLLKELKDSWMAVEEPAA